MKKITTFLFLIIGVVIFSYTHASAEVIKSFDSQIVVNLDSSISVTETIVYDSEGSQKHGIFRDITPVSSEGEPMEIKQISVVDENGASHQWQRQTNDGDVRLKIGDPERVFRGQKTYVIKYNATNAVAHGDIDEIYWNATGNNWPFGIEQASARVHLPIGVSVAQQSCYVGQKGIRPAGSCNSLGEFFSSDRALSAGEGMTVAVGFPSGIVQEYAPTLGDKVFKFLASFLPLLIPVVAFIFMFQKWYRKGRDAKGSGVIVPQYEVIDNLTPLEAAVIIRQKFNARDLTAEILWLATQGYITITHNVEKKFLGKKTEFTLKLKNINTEKLADFDKQLLQEIFYLGTSGPLEEGKEVTLSQSYSLFGIVTSLETKIKKRLVENGYYTKDFITKNVLQTTRFYRGVVVFIIISVFILQTDISTVIVSALLSRATELTAFLLLPSIVVTAIIVSLFSTVMPAKTQKGVRAKEHLLGLKNYIKIAEKDRITFHNAPEVNAILFEKLLPYATMFGLDVKWAAAFEGLTVPPVSWYESTDYGVGTGRIVATPVLVGDLSRELTSNFFMAASSGSGSGGGGFSGGGGGGGGGGSW